MVKMQDEIMIATRKFWAAVAKTLQDNIGYYPFEIIAFPFGGGGVKAPYGGVQLRIKSNGKRDDLMVVVAVKGENVAMAWNCDPMRVKGSKSIPMSDFTSDVAARVLEDPCITMSKRIYDK